MGHLVTIPDEVYDRLAEDAGRQGLSPDRFLAELLSKRYVSGRGPGTPLSAGLPDDLGSLRQQLTEGDLALLDAFTGTWDAPPGFDPVELVRERKEVYRNAQ